MNNIGIGIRGELSVKVFDANKRLKYQESGIKNFITSTGLCYPAYFPFADCFRFVSLGIGSEANTYSKTDTSSLPDRGRLLGWGTTGLSQSVVDIDGSHPFEYIGSRNYSEPGNINSEIVSQYLDSSCGFSEGSIAGNTETIALTRGWRIPVGDEGFASAYNFEEVMLTPGTPRVIGYSDAEKTIPVSICHCNEYAYDNNSNVVFGNDCATIASQPFDTYSNIKNNDGSSQSICHGYLAFARILKTISVDVGDSAYITYTLKLTYPTGQTAASYVKLVGGGNWGADAYYTGNLIHAGIRLINNGNLDASTYTGPNNTARQQWEGYEFANEYGESFVPAWGCPLEPSIPTDNLYAYVSNDNFQFSVNGTGGGKMDPLATAAKLNLPGTFQWHTKANSNLKNLDGFDGAHSTYWYNIRQNGAADNYPDPTDITKTTIEAQAKTMDTLLGESYPDMTISYAKHSRISHVPLNENLSSDDIKASRSRSSLYSFELRGVDIGQMDSKPVKTITWGFAEWDGNTMVNDAVVPFYDLVFRSTDLGITKPKKTSSTTYSIPSNDPDTSPKYYYISNSTTWTAAFNLTWSTT